MQLLHRDNVFAVKEQAPNYDRNNPLLKLARAIETVDLAAERSHYLVDSLQFLFPIDTFEFYGPQGGDAHILDPLKQDNKTDFQKQNVKDFTMTDTFLVRGIAVAGDWLGPFIKLSYRGGPESQLSLGTRHKLGKSIRLWIKVNSRVCSEPLLVPYNPRTDRYEIEIWSCTEAVKQKLGAKALAAFESKALRFDNTLVIGATADLQRHKLSDFPVLNVVPEDAMHPLHPLRLEVAWTDEGQTFWDSLAGLNYKYTFNMKVRGWDHYLAVGSSSHPHGGIGNLEYRNLFSNYGSYAATAELGRDIEWWNFDAFGHKSLGSRREDFMAVDYMDLHLVRGNAGIGLHRHRDNQEAFLMMDGRALMIVGDWCKFPDRERALEVRTLRSGHLALLKGGQLHALLNTTDEDAHLFMFGGYD